jgi:hypothetical protein
MIKTKQQILYLKNLILFSQKFKKYKPVIFYGTLLGIIRENSIIKNDDDIDLLVNLKFKKNIIKDIKKEKKFHINKKISDKYFVQIFFKVDEITIFIDLYFYTNNKNHKFIIDRHNFFGNINIKKFFLHIPKRYFFPIKSNNKFKDIYMPNKPLVLCKFLYGKNWNIPQKKNANYKMKIINNEPFIVKKNIFSYLVKNIQIFIKNKFK